MGERGHVGWSVNESDNVDVVPQTGFIKKVK